MNSIKTLIGAAIIAAPLAALPALAQENAPANTARDATQRAQQGMEKAGESVSNTADKAKGNAEREMQGDDKKPGLDDGNRTADAGRNSFTEGQARSRIEEQGFTQVTNLKKGDDGIWTAQAMKEGKQTQVQLDYEGDVVERK